MVRWFNLEAIGRSAARFDLKKLDSLNGHYLRHAGRGDHAAPAGTGSRAAEWRRAPAKLRRGWLGQAAAAIPFLKHRAKTLVELLDNADYLFAKGALPRTRRSGEALDPRLAGTARSSFAAG